MYGQLIPCGGGQPIVLSKPKLVLRLRGSSSSETAPVRVVLKFTDGCWKVTVSDGRPRIGINGVACNSGQLMPYDLLSVGRHRYRVSYEPAEVASQRPLPKRAAPPKPAPAPKPAGATLLGALIPCGGGKAMPLRKPKIIVGRLPSCDVVLLDRLVSSHHCELGFRMGYWQARDLDSENGTYVDGQRYHQKWILPGSILGISYQRFRLEYHAEGEQPPVWEDDIPVWSQRPLVDAVGITEDEMDRLPEHHDEPLSERLSIDPDTLD
ncbi:MAG TPA: FHA domain-containing protein [Planctomycetaceae bacterium]|nr:FHA domain-containing protein [Planctomycetaceae bacterium]